MALHCWAMRKSGLDAASFSMIRYSRTIGGKIAMRISFRLVDADKKTGSGAYKKALENICFFFETD
jgi:hypothetical protein